MREFQKYSNIFHLQILLWAYSYELFDLQLF